MFVLALVMTLSQAASIDRTPVVSSPRAEVRVAQAAKKDVPAPEGPGFMEQYFPFGVAESAPQQVKDGFLISQILGILLPAGGLWGPLVLIPGADLSGDTLVSWLVPAGVTAAIYFALVIPIIAVTVITGGLGAVCGFALCPIFIAGSYVSTNATLNGIARNTFGANTGGAKVTPKLTTKPSAPNGGGSGGPASPSYAY